MQKNLISVQYWTDKTTGEVVTKFAKFTEGISKEGKAYGYIDDNVYELVTGQYPIGTITSFTVTMNPPATRNIKLTNSQSSSTESK